MNINAMLKQAQAMQNKLAQAQEKIAQHTLEGASGAGMIKVVVTGSGEVKSIKIDPSLLIPDDVEVLEDLIIAALRDAKEKVDAYSQSEMSSVTGGMNLPGGMKLPF